MLTHLKYKGEQQEIKKEAEKLQNESKAFLKKHVSPPPWSSALVCGTLLVSLLQLFIDFTTTQGLSLSTFVL